MDRTAGTNLTFLLCPLLESVALVDNMGAYGKFEDSSLHRSAAIFSDIMPLADGLGQCRLPKPRSQSRSRRSRGLLAPKTF